MSWRAPATLLLAAALHSAALAQPAAAAEAPAVRLLADEKAREDAGDLEGAIRACEEILRRDPKEPRAMNTIAGLDGKLRRFRDEIAWARRALAVDPGFFQAEINLGSAQAALGQAKAAQASFERARHLAPTNPMPAYSLGVLAENRHDVAAATALYAQSVTLDPAFESGWFNLAAMHATSHRFDDALADLDKLLALNPRADGAREMRRHVEADKAAARR
jgi:tetratricopeptide (TPR) repeat protein